MGVKIEYFDKLNIEICKTPIMLVDSSYLTFNRFYASIKMYTAKHKKTIEEEDIETDEFLDIFTKNYFKSLKKMIKRFKIKYINVYFVRDCPRDNIWRINEYKEYKKNRGTTIKYKKNKFNVGKIFKYVYSTIFPFLVNNYGINIIQVNEAEADDIIAIMCKYYNNVNNCNNIYIISEDKDMYQLLKYDKVQIYSMKFKRLGLNISYEDILRDKIINGDKMDNIPSINIKEIDLDNNINTEKRYRLKRNMKIIDFDYIPQYIEDRVCNQVNYLQNMINSNYICEI